MHKIVLALVIVACCASNVLAAAKTTLPIYDLQIDRYGPVVIGMTPDEASRKLKVPLIPEGPVEPDDKESQSCHYEYPSGDYQDIGFMVQDGHITRFDISSEKIATKSKIRIGDSEEEVKKAFPGKVTEEIHPYIGNEANISLLRQSQDMHLSLKLIVERLPVLDQGDCLQ